jgi:hypothetical protein
MDSSSSNTAKINALIPHTTVTYGWAYHGLGPARYGWTSTTAAGATVYLGRSAEVATETARKLGPAWGAAVD